MRGLGALYGYSLPLASSVGGRDGMSIELAGPGGEQVAEVFEDAASGERTVRLAEPLALPLVEWFLAEARTQVVTAHRPPRS